MTCEESTVISVGIRSEFVFQKLPRARACYSNRNARDRCASSLLSMSEQFGLWLSLVERCVRDAEAVGSNPTSPISFQHSKLKSPRSGDVQKRERFGPSFNAGRGLQNRHANATRRSKLQPDVLDDWIDNCSYGLS